MTGLLKKTRRQRMSLTAFLSHPVTDVVVIMLIISSVILLFLEEAMSLPLESPIPLISDAITFIFAVELSLRFLAAKKKGRFFRRYWPDVLAVLPILRPLRIFRIFRLFRLFRLFQLGVLLDRRIARGAMRINFYFLWVLIVSTAFLIIGSAVVALILERGLHNAAFSNLQQTLWWAAYSIIAGEPVGTALPKSTGGRFLMAAMMLSGMTLFAIFTGIVSATMITRLQGGSQLAEMDIEELDGHVLICGWNTGTVPLLSEMAADAELKDLPLVLVNELERLPDLTKTKVRADLRYHLKGDFTQVDLLKQAGVERASRAVVMADHVRQLSTGDRDARSVLAALTIERLNPEIYCVVELMDENNQAHLGVAGVEAVIMRSELSGLALASACRHPRLMEVMMNLLTMRRGETIHRVEGPRAPIRFDELLLHVKREYGALLIGVERPKDPASRVPTLRQVDHTDMLVNPAPDLIVKPEDWLIVIGGPNHRH